jgi:hypothetical protein
MKLECRLHPAAGQQIHIQQKNPSSYALISVFCAECGAFLFECISHVIASTAVTEHGRLVP